MTLDQIPCVQLRDVALRLGDREALVDVAAGGTRRWSFRAAWTEAERLASSFRALGLTPGERVALWMANRAEFLLLSFAAEIAGLVRVPLNARYTALEVETILADCGPALLLTDAPRFRDAPPPTDTLRVLMIDGHDWIGLRDGAPPMDDLYRAKPEDLCSLNYTSGSSGPAKGVMLTHRNWAAVYRNLLTDRDIRADDRLVHIGPLSHASGAYAPAYFLGGAANVIAPAGQGLEGLLRTIAVERGTVFTAVPTLLTRLVDFPRLKDYDLSSLRLIGYGAEPIPPGTLTAAVARFGPILAANYGLTEAMMTCCCLQPDPVRPDGGIRSGVIGRPYTHVEVVLREPDGTPVPDGEIGELTVRSPHVMQGYWNRPEETARILRDGWLWSGDLARVGDDGILELVGRSKDMLICGGFNIYPQQVERELAAAPGVREVAVVGIPDAQWGEIPVAFVVGERLSEQRLRDWARPRLGLRTPKRWNIVGELPRTPVGKVDRLELRAFALAGQETTQ